MNGEHGTRDLLIGAALALLLYWHYRKSGAATGFLSNGITPAAAPNGAAAASAAAPSGCGCGAGKSTTLAGNPFTQPQVKYIDITASTPPKFQGSYGGF